MTQARVEAAKQAINEALALFQQRWLLRVVWELRAGPLTFRQLQEQCGGLSPSVLNQRLGELRDAGLLDRGGEADGGGYRLTPLGLALLEAFAPLTQWALRWQRQRSRRRPAAAEGE